MAGSEICDSVEDVALSRTQMRRMADIDRASDFSANALHCRDLEPTSAIVRRATRCDSITDGYFLEADCSLRSSPCAL